MTKRCKTQAFTIFHADASGDGTPFDGAGQRKLILVAPGLTRGPNLPGRPFPSSSSRLNARTVV